MKPIETQPKRMKPSQIQWRRGKLDQETIETVWKRPLTSISCVCGAVQLAQGADADQQRPDAAAQRRRRRPVHANAAAANANEPQRQRPADAGPFSVLVCVFLFLKFRADRSSSASHWPPPVGRPITAAATVPKSFEQLDRRSCQFEKERKRNASNRLVALIRQSWNEEPTRVELKCCWWWNRKKTNRLEGR